MNILANKVVKARKQYTCDWCGKQIEKGEQHQWSKAIQDGQFYEWRGCKRCEPYRSEVFKALDSWGDGVTVEKFKEFMKEEHKEIAGRWWENVEN